MNDKVYVLNIFDSGADFCTWFEVTKITDRHVTILRYERNGGKVTRTRHTVAKQAVQLKNGHLRIDAWAWDRVIGSQITKDPVTDEELVGIRTPGPHYAKARYQAKRIEHAENVRVVRKQLEDDNQEKQNMERW